MRSTVFVLAILCLCISYLHANELPSHLISICSEEGIAMLESEFTYKESYEISLVHGVTQNTNTFCGVATSTMILNSLTLDAPNDIVHGFPYFNQDNFFSPEVTDILPASNVTQSGYTLDQLGEALKTWEYGYYENEEDRPEEREFQVEDIVFANEVYDLDAFKEDLITHMSAIKSRMIVNFARTSLGQEGGGHFSPIVAYNAEFDYVLLFDVARYKYDCPTYWVSTSMMFNAMDTLDFTSNAHRGFILINDPHVRIEDEDLVESEGPQWYVAFAVLAGAMSYSSFLTIAVCLIVAAIYLVVRNRRKRRASVPIPSVDDEVV